MKIKEIMSKKLITCNPDDNILFVSNLMNAWDIGFILIMEKDKLFGVVTDRDLVCDMANQLSQIKSYATKNVITIEEDKDIKDALKLMKKNKIKRLVVTKDKDITGVLSLSDIFQLDDYQNEILDTIKTIYEINRNDNYFNADVNDFPL
ncbi:MAG: CBS domain-containing protein [Bacilli bacterium]|nr:CBS domain-containing protein [Bacilli bacterium]